MTLHEVLRDLVRARGAGIVGDADELRAALDDFLAEHEASVGEINLLVDAVRLGAFDRLVHLLDQGGAPAAVLDETAASLARDRGTDDPARSRWALAALGYAVGRLDAATVTGGSQPAAPADAAAPATDPASTDAEVRTVPTGAEPTGAEPTGAEPTGADAVGTEPTGAVPTGTDPPGAEPTGTDAVVTDPVPTTLTDIGPTPAVQQLPPRPPTAGSGRRPVRAIGAVILVSAVLGGTGWWLWGERSDPAEDPAASERTDGAESPVLGPDDLLVPVVGDDGVSTVYAVNAVTGATTDIVDTDEDVRLPAVDHARTTVVVLVKRDGPARSAAVLEDGELVPFFDPSGPCAYSARPAWSPDDRQVAMVCVTADGTSTGLYRADVGAYPLQVTEVDVQAEVLGTPTWVDADRVVASVAGDGGREELWSIDVADGDSAPFGGPVDAAVTHATYSAAAGSVLAVHTDAAGATSGELWRYRPDGSGAEQIGESGGPFASPVWSPDGSRIAYLAEVDGALRLAVAPAADPADATLVDVARPGTVGVPAWGSR